MTRGAGDAWTAARQRAHGPAQHHSTERGKAGGAGARAELARDAGHRAEAAGLARVEEQPLVRPRVGEQERAAVRRPGDRAEAPGPAEEHALAEAAAGGAAGARPRCARSPGAGARGRSCPAAAPSARARAPRPAAARARRPARRRDRAPAGGGARRRAARRPSGAQASSRTPATGPLRHSAPPRVDRGDRDAPALVGERQHVAGVGAPGRRHAAVGRAVAPVARPVAVDHPQGAAGEVGDAEAVHGRPAGRR